MTKWLSIQIGDMVHNLKEGDGNLKQITQNIINLSSIEATYI